MNRLILVGNGFDIAHGLKTRYRDFIFWYLDRCFDNAGIYANGHFYEDDFLRVEVLEHYRLMSLSHLCQEHGLCHFLYKRKLLHRYLNFFAESTIADDELPDDESKISNIISHKVSFKSSFFERLVNSCLECGWVDIENEYFDELKKCVNSDGVYDVDDVRWLNQELTFLKSKLEEYLSTQKLDTSIGINPDLLQLMNAAFREQDFDTVIDDEDILRQQLGKDFTVKDIASHHVYVLNFNYTNTLDGYLEQFIKGSEFSRVEVNHIHGELNSVENPIIFGFGDEYDKTYLTFEEQRINELFEHIKSYKYLKTPNYRDLVRFLNKGDYQVFVMGHSCGLSDRTMFKEIFDHQHCKSVRIFHYTNPSGENDFHDKTINLGRHFSDKGRMRKLIVEFNAADAFPQRHKSV